MTVIAANGEMMACDTQSTAAGIGQTYGTKITRVHQVSGLPDLLIGIAGDWTALAWARSLRNTEVSDIDEANRLWAEFLAEERARGQRDNNNNSRAQAVMLTGGRVYECDPGGFVLVPDSGYAAIGSGREVALGALWTGEDPDVAVCAAMDLSIYCGGQMIVERP